jgi:PilZ domain
LLSTKPQEQRREERVLVTHTVRLPHSQDVTRDISASGVYFWVDATFSVGETINFVIEFGKLGVNFILKCVGEIVRVENRNGKVGLAVKISHSVMESA